jgi:hypothetical protein
MACLLLALMSGLASSPIGAGLLLAALGLSTAHPRLAVMLAFASSFLPSVGGIPVAGAFVVSIWFAIRLALDAKGVISRLPSSLTIAAAATLGVAAATYPIHRSADVTLLAASVIVMIACADAVRRGALCGRAVLSDVMLALGAVVVVPLLFNGTLVIYSPFWFDRHTGLFMIDRFTVGAAEANVVSAYMAAAFTAVLFSVRFESKQFAPLAKSCSLAIALAIGAMLGGSRISVGWCGGALVVAAVLSLANSRDTDRVAWLSVRAATLTLIAIGAAGIAAHSLAFGRLPAGIERLASTTGLEETGRPKSLREASERLDSVPVAGIDYRRYVLHEAAHTPHASPAAALLFLGLPLACLAFSLMALPGIDLLARGGVSPFLGLGVASASLFVILATLPVTSDRGLLALTGIWFGLSRFASLKQARGASTPAGSSVTA